jgi:hypothetical protein
VVAMDSSCGLVEKRDAPESLLASSGASGRAKSAHAKGPRARLDEDRRFRWTWALGWGRSFGGIGLIGLGFASPP